MKRFFITGVGGFIGFHLAKALLSEGNQVFGYDGLTPYYDPGLKRARLNELHSHGGFRFAEGMLEDVASLGSSYRSSAPDVVFHLAAQAGVRYSIENPQAYISSNVVGTANLLEVMKDSPPAHFLFASTSSVYGGNPETPFSELAATRSPVSLYAATKLSGEAMTHSYSHLYGIATTCFRFFTVYGPWGRPDMALFKFVERIEEGREIEIYGEGEMTRDFTYIDDLVSAAVALSLRPPVVGEPVTSKDTLSVVAPWRVVNIGGGHPVGLTEFVSAVETAMGRTATKRFLPMQPGDVRTTSADCSLLTALTGARPSTPVHDGVVQFVEWYRQFRAGIASE